MIGAILLATAAGGVVACQPTDSSKATGTPASGVTTSASKDDKPSAAERKTVPNFVGMGLQSAQDAAQEQGFYSLKSHDALGRDRTQILDRDWKVCSQNVKAGTSQSTDTTLDFGAVKLAEKCPAKDEAAPSAAGGEVPRLGEVGEGGAGGAQLEYVVHRQGCLGCGSLGSGGEQLEGVRAVARRRYCTQRAVGDAQRCQVRGDLPVTAGHMASSTVAGQMRVRATAAAATLLLAALTACGGGGDEMADKPTASASPGSGKGNAPEKTPALADDAPVEGLHLAAGGRLRGAGAEGGEPGGDQGGRGRQGRADGASAVLPVRVLHDGCLLGGQTGSVSSGAVAGKGVAVLGHLRAIALYAYRRTSAATVRAMRSRSAAGSSTSIAAPSPRNASWAWSMDSMGTVARPTILIHTAVDLDGPGRRAGANGSRRDPYHGLGAAQPVVELRVGTPSSTRPGRTSGG